MRIFHACDVACYRDREGEVNLNQQALRLSVQMVGEERSSHLHFVPFSLLNERSLDQSSVVNRRGGGRGKVG